MNKNPFLGERKLKFVKKMCNIFFFKLFPKFSDFFNSNDCIGKKSHQNLSGYIQTIIMLTRSSKGFLIQAAILLYIYLNGISTQQ